MRRLVPSTLFNISSKMSDWQRQGLTVNPFFLIPSDASVEILCKDESVLAAMNEALRDIEGQCRISVRASVDGGVSASTAGPVLTHSVSESCRGELHPF